MNRKRLSSAAAVLALCAAVSACGAHGATPRPTAATRAAPIAYRSVPVVRAIEQDDGGAAGGSARPSVPTIPVASSARSPRRPRIVAWYIPFGSRRKAEMRAYARRHYGLDTYRLRNPRVIVEHWTETTTAAAARNTFLADVPDSELHELPATCAHFLVDRDGTIYQLVSTTLMCRHTVGLNYTSIGIEHVGLSDAQVMGDRRQLAASLALTTWLRCRYDITAANVIGHAESLSSPYHHERVAALKTQTHSDMQPFTMRRYRALLRRASC